MIATMATEKCFAVKVYLDAFGPVLCPSRNRSRSLSLSLPVDDRYCNMVVVSGALLYLAESIVSTPAEKYGAHCMNSG